MLFPIKIRSINGGKTLGGAPRFFTSKGPQSKFTSAWIAVSSTEQAFLLTPSWLGVLLQKNIKIQFCITTHNIRKHSASKAFHGNAVYYVHHTSLHIPRFFTQIGLGLRNMSLGCQQHTIPKVYFSSKIYLGGENVYIFWTKIGLLEHCATSANKKGSLFF